MFLLLFCFLLLQPLLGIVNTGETTVYLYPLDLKFLSEWAEIKIESVHTLTFLSEVKVSAPSWGAMVENAQSIVKVTSQPNSHQITSLIHCSCQWFLYNGRELGKKIE